MVTMTLKVIKNIEKYRGDYEIILIDNSDNWPQIGIPNLRVVKGYQHQTKEDLLQDKDFTSHQDFNKDTIDWVNDTMWASYGYYKGIKESKGDYIVLQHNDVFYYDVNKINDMIEDLDIDNLEYISVDNKKISLLSYIINQELFDKHIDEEKQFSPHYGGILKTTKLGLSDAYFFLSRKKFFDDYDVDWRYGDSNHGATIKCLEQGLKYLHLGPFYDNPNFETMVSENYNTYYYDSTEFLSHLKGGFSENKISLTKKQSTNKFLESINARI
tara:strand:- start:899 stop:1711 length:813 start_codon:yes stop_codon:yes gene_type:complete